MASEDSPTTPLRRVQGRGRRPKRFRGRRPAGAPPAGPIPDVLLGATPADEFTALQEQPQLGRIEELDTEQSLHLRLISSRYLPASDHVQPRKTYPMFLDTSVYDPPWFQLPDLPTHEISVWFDWQVSISLTTGCRGCN